MTEGRPRRPDKKPLTRSYITPEGLTPRDQDKEIGPKNMEGEAKEKVKRQRIELLGSHFIVRRHLDKDSGSKRKKKIAEEKSSLLNEANKGFSRLREDSERWGEERSERKIWETTLLDGLDKADMTDPAPNIPSSINHDVASESTIVVMPKDKKKGTKQRKSKDSKKK